MKCQKRITGSKNKKTPIFQKIQKIVKIIKFEKNYDKTFLNLQELKVKYQRGKMGVKGLPKKKKDVAHR